MEASDPNDGGALCNQDWVRASVLWGRDQGRSLWGSQTDLHLGPGAWILTASELGASKLGWWGAPGMPCVCWTPDTSPHDDLSLSIRHNYVEGTKMLAAYLYEVSQLKD